MDNNQFEQEPIAESANQFLSVFARRHPLLTLAAVNLVAVVGLGVVKAGENIITYNPNKPPQADITDEPISWIGAQITRTIEGMRTGN
jgi:hypothetical protein